MTQILEFRNEEKECILKVNLDMKNTDYIRKRIEVTMLGEELKAKEVSTAIKDDNGKYYFTGVYNV